MKKIDDNKIKRISACVFGKVQGVFFRKFVFDKAIELNLTGFVRNELDGSVCFEAQGNEDDLMKLIDDCWDGSKFAEVDNIDFCYIDVSDYEEEF